MLTNVPAYVDKIVSPRPYNCKKAGSIHRFDWASYTKLWAETANVSPNVSPVSVSPPNTNVFILSTPGGWEGWDGPVNRSTQQMSSMGQSLQKHTMHHFKMKFKDRKFSL